MAQGFKIADAYVEVHTRYKDEKLVKDLDRALGRKQGEIQTVSERRVGTPLARGAERSFAREIARRNRMDTALDKKMRTIAVNAVPAFFQSFVETITLGMADLPTGAIAKSPIFAAVGAAVAATLAVTIVSGLSAALISAFAGGFGLGVIAIAFAGTMDELKGEIESFKTALKGALEASDVLVEPFRAALNLLTVAIRDATPWLRGFFEIFDPTIVPLAQGLIGFFEAMGPGLEAMGRVAADALLELAEALPGMGKALGDMFMRIEEDWPDIKESMGEFMNDTWNVLRILGNVFMWLATHYHELKLALKVMTFPPAFIFIMNAPDGIKTALRQMLQYAIDFSIMFPSYFLSIPGKVISAISSLPGRMRAWAAGIKASMVSGASSIVWGFLTPILGLPNRAMSAVNPLRGRITGFFSGAGGWLTSAGNRIIGGLVDGINWAVDNWLRPTLNWVTGMIPDWKGPADVDSKLLTENGRLIAQSLMDGFTGRASMFPNEFGALTMALPGMIPQPRQESRGGPINVEVKVDATGATPEAAQAIGRETAKAIREALDSLDRSRR